MNCYNLLGKPLDEAKLILNENSLPYNLVKVLSPREDILGQDERVIKVEENETLIIYYSLF